MYMNADRHDRTKITCPSLEFLKLLCHACENSAWCSHFYLTDRHGKSIPCNATPGHPNYIEDLDVEFDAVYYACGSGGTGAGLALGMHASSLQGELVGLCVDDTPQECVAPCVSVIVSLLPVLYSV